MCQYWSGRCFFIFAHPNVKMWHNSRSASQVIISASYVWRSIPTSLYVLVIMSCSIISSLFTKKITFIIYQAGPWKSNCNRGKLKLCRYLADETWSQVTLLLIQSIKYFFHIYLSLNLKWNMTTPCGSQAIVYLFSTHFIFFYGILNVHGRWVGSAI